MSLDMEPNSEEHHQVVDAEEVAYNPTYADAFPPLPEVDSTREKAQATTTGPWKGTGRSLRSSTITQMFSVPIEERKYKDINEQRFGQTESQSKICQDIMNKTGVAIEISLARDQSLTVLITGKADSVMKARRLVVGQLQTQANTTLKIPKEHHRFILGPKGKKLQDLELNTATKISIPKPADNSDMITIQGTKEGIDKAAHEIQCISEEQSKLAFERLNVKKEFHPFICGPNNCFIQELIEKTGARINVPPPSVMKDEIVVSGEKEGVHQAVKQIMSVYEEKKRKCQTVSVEVRKTQHKYVIGPRGANLSEILQNTGVSVEVPPLDSTSETITLRGEQDKLGPALTMVYSKANSVVIADVEAPSWLHRFIIGKNGANIRQVTQDLPKVHIEFTDGQNKIVVEGPPEEVEQAQKALKKITEDLLTRMDYAEISVDPKYHRHIIGKSGANVTRIKNETGVAIRIPSDTDKSHIIRIEGDPAGVANAKKQLQDMVHKMENERSRDIMIEQRFHRNIIGAKGENIREIRDKFNQVQITFPDQGRKSNVVTLRGPKNDVDKCFTYLTKMHSEMITNNYQADVHIFKQFHKNIIGKGGANIRKIREETETRIDLPSENSDSDAISIVGKKANVEKARSMIEAMQKELANIREVTIEIPHKLHNSVIGAKGRLIKSIMEECGGVIVRFPPEGSTSDKVVIRGPKDDVENAKKQLLELSTERKESSFTADIRAKPEYHKFLIGRGGANIKKVRDKTGARIIFPGNSDQDQELITVIGKKNEVEEARVELERLIKDLDNITEGEINIDTKYHRHFVARRGEVLRQIADDYGGVTVSFPRSGVKSDKVTLKGAKDCVEGAKKRILEIVADLEAQISIDCVIPQKYHRTVMGAKGYKVQEITHNWEVGIKFPEKPTENDANGTDHGSLNGDAASESSNEGEKSPKKEDTIVITGRKENCESARDALLALVPITKEISVPFDFHRFIIGTKGKDVRKMMQDHDVSISIPAPDEHSDIVKVSGAPANVEQAEQAMAARVEQLEKEKEDRDLRSFKLEVQVDPQYHPKIIGRKGAVITKIRMDNDVQIQFPDQGGENQDVIIITGYEQNTTRAREDILKIVHELEDMIAEEVIIDHRVHSRLIGTRGRAIRKIMDDYKVDIRFPRSDSGDPDLVVITGNEDDVLDCREHILNIAEEYMQDISDREQMQQYIQPQRGQQDNYRGNVKQTGFHVRDAPWDHPAPDSSSTMDFPALGAGAPAADRGQGAASGRSVVWGPAIKR